MIEMFVFFVFKIKLKQKDSKRKRNKRQFKFLNLMNFQGEYKIILRAYALSPKYR